MTTESYTLADIRECFTGLVPSVIATASAAGVPNITYISRVHPVDDDRIAVSNQFLSKSSRNLAENPHASIIVSRYSDTIFDQFRITADYERTERRGPVFDRLKNDVSMIAAITGMEGVFRLQAADIYRVISIDRMPSVDVPVPAGDDVSPIERGPGQLGELCARISRCTDLDALLQVTVEGLDELLGYPHSQILLLDETSTRLFTIASHGYPDQGVGAEVEMGTGIIGSAAERCAPINNHNLNQMTRYAHSVRKSYEESGYVGPGRSVPLAGLALPGSQLAVPALALGQLVGVLFVESELASHFSTADMAMLTTVGALVASSIESLRSDAGAPALPDDVASGGPPPAEGSPMHVKFFADDGSTFLDGEYLIKGVAGKLLWSMLRQYQAGGRTEFTNREMRLDPTLELPDFRDNFESRLILLKRRLDERDSLIRIHKTGRGQFRLAVASTLRLEEIPAAGRV